MDVVLTKSAPLFQSVRRALIEPHRFCRIFAECIGVLVAMLGVAVLVGGWLLDVAVLRIFIPGWEAVKPNSALALICIGNALRLACYQPVVGLIRWGLWAHAGIALAIGLMTASQYLFDMNLGIDSLLYPDRDVATSGEFPGRPAPNTAIALSLLAIALFVLDSRARIGKLFVAELLAVSVCVISYFALVAYIVRIPLLDQVLSYTSMALPTALALFASGVGVLCARSTRGGMSLITGQTAGSFILRRLIPFVIFLPLLFFVLPESGYYRGQFNTTVALALSCTFITGIFIYMSLRWARRIDHIERTRDAVLDELKELNRSLEARVDERTRVFNDKNAELRLEVASRLEAENQLRHLFESAPDALIVCDDAGIIELVNSQTEHVFGYSRSELIGQPVEILIPETLRHKHQTHRARYLDAPRRRAMGLGIELRGQRKDGSQFPVDVSLSPFIAREGMKVITGVRDISERKQLELELRSHSARLLAVAETANDAIITADGAGVITFFNRAAENMFGYTAQEAVGQNLTILMPPEYHERHTRGMREFIRTQKGTIIGSTVELTGQRKDGSRFIVDVSLANFSIDQETHFASIMRDVTSRKAAEREVLDLNHALKLRNAELEALNRELETFNYSASHDLRTPLRSISSFSQILLSDYAATLDAEGQHYLHRIRDAALRMGKLIDGLLDLSRVSREELQVVPVNLSDMAIDCVAALQEAEPERAVTVDIEPGLTASGDPTLLRAAMCNLIENAWKFTCDTADAKIHFGMLESDSAERVFFVQDNGVGFDMAYVHKLFHAFQRLHAHTEFSGTGIGLATVQRIITKHGGRIWVDAALGKGAAFYFTLGGGK